MGTEVGSPKNFDKEVESHSLPTRHITRNGPHPLLDGLLLHWECNGEHISALNSELISFEHKAWEVQINGKKIYRFNTNEETAAFINKTLDKAERRLK